MAYVFSLNTPRSHLIITTPTHKYALPYVELTLAAPQMPPGQEMMVFRVGGHTVVAVPFNNCNLVGATWQDKLQDLDNNYMFMGIGGTGTLTGIIAGGGISTDGAVPQPTITNTSQGFYMDGNSFLVSATHPDAGTNPRVFTTIQDAFTALEALAGTGHFSIYVSPGDYNEGPVLTANQYELSLIAMGTVTLTGDLTMDCQGSGSITVTSEGGTFYGISFFHSGHTTNQPLTRLEHVHMSNKIIDSSGAGGAYFYLEDCEIPHFHCFFLEEALNTSFCTLSDLVVDSRANRISDCTFGPQTVTINSWQNASSGLRNCQFQGGASVFNGPGQLQLDNASYYSFLEQGWTCATSFLWIDRLPPSGVTAGSYTHASLTVDATGVVTAASSGTSGVTSVGAFSNTGTANGASIAGTVITMRAGSPSTPGMGNVMTHVAGICAVGNNCFPQVNAGSVGTNITALGASAYGAASLVTNSANNNTSIGANTMSQISTASECTCLGYYAGNHITTGGNNTFVGSSAGAATNTGTSNTYVGVQAGSAATNQTQNTFLGYRAGYNSSSTQGTYVGGNAGASATGNNAVYLGYSCGQSATGNSNVAIGVSSYASAATGTLNVFVGSSAGNAALGATQDVGIGRAALAGITTGFDSVAIGNSALSNSTTGNNNIGIGSSCSLAAAGDSNCIVIGKSTVGNGSGTTTIGTAYIPSAVGTSFLKYDTATGAVTRDVSSRRYKTLLPGAPPVDKFVNRLFDLTPRAYTLNNDPSSAPRIGYIAEEVEEIVGPHGNPVFGSLLIYTMLDDLDAPPVKKEHMEWVDDEEGVAHPVVSMVEVPAKKRAVESINYAGFVVPLIELCKQQQARIEALEARLTAAGIP